MASGKTYCADYLANYHGYNKFSLAGKLKNVAKELFGIVDKSDQSRAILQKIGVDMREIDSEVWIKYLLNNIKDRAETRKVVVDDLRFQNEADWFVTNGFTLILVTVDEKTRQERLQALYPGLEPNRQQHISELEWVKIKPDYSVASIEPEIMHEKVDGILQNVATRSRWEE